MNIRFIIFTFSILVFLSGCSPKVEKQNESVEKKAAHSFKLDSTGFLLDDQPFQIISGEMHYARMPKAYWRHRIQMAKALGCNTIATYVFWNYHETEKGIFDFSSEGKNIQEFLEIIQDEGMYCLFRPGPYSCGEWDLGGIPPYLLSIPDIKLRCTDERYMSAVNQYITSISKELKPWLITHGGPVIMVQIENEYGSYGNDREYLKAIKSMWEQNGIDVPFYTSDGATTYMLEAGTLPGVAVGLDPGYSAESFALARKMNPGVPVFSSETYPGWLTHWGEDWARPDTADLLSEVRFLLDNKLSFNFYVLHGGTNFGFAAGANSGGLGYEPDITSYDYDAPIDEQGRPTPKYFAIRKLLSKYSGSEIPLPAAIPVVSIPEIKMEAFTSVWNQLPAAIAMVQPKPFEYFGLNYGFALYKTKLIGHKSGNLKITQLHDFATVFLDGVFVGTIDRRKGENSIKLPETKSEYPVLEILVEGMGRINFAQELIDRKGITERVSLNGMTLMNWEVYPLPMNSADIKNLTPSTAQQKQGMFFKGSFTMNELADTYLDMTGYKKGMVWVNGHNLGRYWEIGPQHSLYCPATFLQKGENEIMVFDLLQLEPVPLKGSDKLI